VEIEGFASEPGDDQEQTGRLWHLQANQLIFIKAICILLPAIFKEA
jgi:hypothetical protein